MPESFPMCTANSIQTRGVDYLCLFQYYSLFGLPLSARPIRPWISAVGAYASPPSPTSYRGPAEFGSDGI